MGLTSLNFFLFLAASLVVYFLLSEKYQWRWLFAVSCFFYVYCSRTLSIFIAVTCVATYVLSILIENSEVRYKDELKQIKAGETMAALCNEGAWFLVFILAGAGFALGQLVPGLIAAVVVLVITQSYGKKGVIGKAMGVFGSLYNGITGYFSDILSYSRLMALMLAGAVVAQVFNKLGAITGNIVTFFIIAMVGNALNFALNILGCFVHDMRLQCLEFFGRFYEDGGKPFRPLNINTKYVDVEK